IAGAIASADFVNWDDTRMLKTGCGFRFATKTFHVRFCSPMAQADDLECHGAVETLLPGTINDALAAAADFLQQFIIAEIAEHPSRRRCFLLVACSHTPIPASVAGPGYTSIAEQAKPHL